jgi:hypothetical protein
MKRLKDNIAMCLESLDFTKKLIEDYIRIFEITIKEIGEDETGMPTINKKKVVNFRTIPPKKTKFKGKPFWLRFRKKKE